MYTSNRFASMVNMLHGIVFNITSESYMLSSTSTLYCLTHYILEEKKKVIESDINSSIRHNNQTK